MKKKVTSFIKKYHFKQGLFNQWISKQLIFNPLALKPLGLKQLILRQLILRQWVLKQLIYWGIGAAILGCTMSSPGESVIAGGGGDTFRVIENADLYITELYKHTDETVIVELYVADIRSGRESISLANVGLRSYYREAVAGVAGDLSTTLQDFEFQFKSYYELYKGNLYIFVFSPRSNPTVTTDPIYDSFELPRNRIITAPKENGAIKIPSMSETCALFELYSIEADDSRHAFDFIQLGSACPNSSPKYSTKTWNGIGNLSIPTGGQGQSIVRKLAAAGSGQVFSFTANSYTEEDWQLGQYSPILPPDSECVMLDQSDNDRDGIYDCVEDEVTDTYMGMPLYEWGARSGQKDLFLEIDYMSCSYSGNINTEPQRAALDKVISVMRGHGYALHIDTGKLYDPSPGTNVTHYDLGGGNNYIFSSDDKTNYEGIDLNPTNRGGTNTYFNVKENHFNNNRKQLFYYMLFADSTAPTNFALSGSAEVLGNDSLIVLGEQGINICDVEQLSQANRNLIVNRQAYAIMHELGHNLGLLHGGNEAVANKLNYLSVMNPLYADYGVPTTTRTSLLSNVYYYRIASVNTNLRESRTCLTDSLMDSLDNVLLQDVMDFSLTFSSGLVPSLDENLLNERLEVYQGIYIDYNCNGTLLETGTVAVDLNLDGELTTLRDYNDLANIQLFFYRPQQLRILPARSSEPNTSPTTSQQGIIRMQQPVLSDRQPVISD
ncbi:hypothetical protein COTS27_00673 [Spirochaetota bacterium]|nr:hypothetical protein COTS27_00673 [Spirochaetota bacterium]